jgi:protein-L-isoaspartate(D-aspartate) O-methyltransferase
MATAAEQRERMVGRQLRRRGIVDERVLAAMGSVPRELYVPGRIRDRAYFDAALPIGKGQTISQPWIVAAICQALGLQGDETVLEVGGGRGYTAAVLAELAARVISVELVPELAAVARATLAEQGFGPERVMVVEGDGSLGYTEEAPYDAIALHATAPGPPRTLLSQLSPSGRLVGPIAEDGDEQLVALSRDPRDPERFRGRHIAPCRFVPLLGAEGYAAPR